MKTNNNATRELWLNKAAALMAPLLVKQETKLPEKYQVSVGFPYRSSHKAIGQAWAPQSVEDKTSHMFISPVLSAPIEVLATLLHEMIHVSVGLECKHNGQFRKVAKGLGLEGKMTATYCKEGTDLHGELTKIAEKLGAYPHSVLEPRLKKRGTGGGGWLRYVSETDDTFKVLVSPKTVERCGPPKDPEGEDMVPVD